MVYRDTPVSVRIHVRFPLAPAQLNAGRQTDVDACDLSAFQRLAPRYATISGTGGFEPRVVP